MKAFRSVWPRRNRVRTLAFGDGGALLRPIDPPVASRLSPAKARDAVHEAVSELAPTGALDAGTGDVLDAWIERLRPQWLAHHAMVGADREAGAQLAAGEYEARAAEARHRADAARARRDATRRVLRIYEQRLIVPNEAAPSDRPDRRRRPRPALDTLEGFTSSWSRRVVSLLLLLLAAAGDFVNFWTVVAGLTGENGTLLWILTGAFAAAAVGLMHVAGRTARNRREHQGGLGRVALTVLFATWTALGVAAFYVRLQVGGAGAAEQDVFGGVVATDEPDPLLAAVLLAALYLAAGVLAFFIGFADHHPRMTPFRKLRAQLARDEEAAATTERAAIEAERLADNARAEVDRTRARVAAAKESIDAEIAELKELARLHIARLIGEPASTNNLTTGRERLTDAVAPDVVVPSPAPARDDVLPVPVPQPVLNGHAAGRGTRR